MSEPRSLNSAEIIQLCQILVSVRNAGVPLAFGLEQASQSATSRLSLMLRQLAADVNRGQSLEAALGSAPNALPPLFRAMLASGITAIQGDELLENVSQTSLILDELRSACWRGCIYPAFVLLVAVGLFILTGQVLLPQLKISFESSALPPTLGVILSIPPVLWILGISLLLGMLILVVLWPVGIRPILLNIRACRTAQFLSVLINHGTPLHTALKLSADACGHLGYQQDLQGLSESVAAGRSLRESISSCRSLPPLLCWGLALADGNSRLSLSLKDVSNVYRERATYRADWLAEAFPGIVIVLIAGGATLCYGLLVFVPIRDLWSQLEGL